MQRKLLLLSLKRLALLPKSSKKAIICAFYDVFAKPRSVTYDKYAPSRELAKNLENPSNSRLFRREFFLGVPAGYCVPVGLMVTFKGWDFLFFRRYLRFRGVCSCVFLNIVI